MNYQTRSKRPKPIEAFQWLGGALEGYTLETTTKGLDGFMQFQLSKEISTEPRETIFVNKGDWLVNGAWLTPAEFDALYEKVPDPEPEPAPVVEEVPAVETVAAPPKEEEQVLSIGPAALDVDQGPWSQ